MEERITSRFIKSVNEIGIHSSLSGSDLILLIPSYPVNLLLASGSSQSTIVFISNAIIIKAIRGSKKRTTTTFDCFSNRTPLQIALSHRGGSFN
jgi:hypothetical protein